MLTARLSRILGTQRLPIHSGGGASVLRVCVHHMRTRAGFVLLPSERAAGGVEVPVFLCCDTAPSPLVSLPLSRCPVWCLRSLLAEAGLFRYENVAPGKGHAY